MGVNLDDRKIDFVMVEEPLEGHRQERQGDGAQQAEIKKEKAKSAQRHEKRKEGKDERQIRQGWPCQAQQQTTEQKGSRQGQEH